MTSPIKIGNATLFLGDCREILPTLNNIGGIIADPPYGISLHAMCGSYRDRWTPQHEHSQRQGMKLIHGDDEPFDPAHLLSYPSVCIWGGIHFADRLPHSRAWVIWDKREETTSDNQADCELAWTNWAGPARIYRQLWRGIVRRGEENVSRESRCHPTQKPVALMDYCISRSGAGINSAICDPYMGSGSTGIAALRRGYRFIGIEIDKRHFETACERIENEQRQLKMFA